MGTNSLSTNGYLNATAIVNRGNKNGYIQVLCLIVSEYRFIRNLGGFSTIVKSSFGNSGTEIYRYTFVNWFVRSQMDLELSLESIFNLLWFLGYTARFAKHGGIDSPWSDGVTSWYEIWYFGYFITSWVLTTDCQDYTEIQTTCSTGDIDLLFWLSKHLQVSNVWPHSKLEYIRTVYRHSAGSVSIHASNALASIFRAFNQLYAQKRTKTVSEWTAQFTSSRCITRARNLLGSNCGGDYVYFKLSLGSREKSRALAGNGDHFWETELRRLQTWIEQASGVAATSELYRVLPRFDVGARDVDIANEISNCEAYIFISEVVIDSVIV